ncbi:MAG: HAD-IIA family hydrolase [Mesorhizobium sp.]
MSSKTIKAVISDLDGVVYRGEEAIPGSIDTIKTWAQRGIPYVFVTNNASRSAKQFASKIRKLGAPVEPQGVVTSAEATAGHFGISFPRGTSVFAIGEPVLFDALEREGARLTDADDAEVVVLGFDYDLTYAKLRRAVRAVMGGARLLVTNPDRITPTESGFEPCVGATLAAITAAVPSVQPVIIGKPSPLMINEALRRLGSDPQSTIMIGDQVATDIVAGQAAGLRSFLVQSGVAAITDPQAVPDAIYPSLAHIPFD